MESNKEKQYNFLRDGTFYIHGRFSEEMSIEFIPLVKKEIDLKIQEIKTIKESKIVDSEKERQLKNIKIVFDIHSAGGKIDTLFVLLNLIEYAKASGVIIETHTHYAASCASLLAIYGTKGHRYGGSFSTHYIHNARGSQFITNDIENLNVYENTKQLLGQIKDMYVKNTKIRQEVISKKIDHEHWQISGADLKKYSLIDKFFDEREAQDIIDKRL